VTLVEIHRIAGQKASHKDGKLGPVAAQKGVDVLCEAPTYVKFSTPLL
jgi:hypothetical protein